MNSLITLDITPNPKGLCALNSNADTACHLAFPATPASGDVVIYDALNLNVLNIIKAHSGVLSALAFTADGGRLATVSETGTVVRVFRVPDGEKLGTFRRGSLGSRVYNLAFSLNGAFLCASSATGTIHVFAVPTRDQPTESKTLIASYLGARFSDVVEPARDFARVRLKSATSYYLAALGQPSSDGATMELLVVTAEGYFCQYSLDTVVGGDCRLDKESLLLASESEEIHAKVIGSEGESEG